MRPRSDKIKPREEVAALCAQARAEGKKVGFTSGAFDLLHAGHVDYLEKARQACDLLVVGVNSDASVRAYKGPHRPIIPAQQRAEVVAALECVDLVFIFSERRNKVNIELLRPDLYIKAGDYRPAELTSSEVVERCGGRVLLLPVATPLSSTEIIARAAAAHVPQAAPVERDGAVHIRRPPPKQAPAVFVDRDGTILEDVPFLHEPDKVRLLPAAAAGLKRLQDMGYRIVVLTNQAGIGLGYFTLEDFYRVNSAMLKLLDAHGVRVDKVYFCPHGLAEQCECRKPGTALLRLAQEQLNVDLHHSVVIGDRTADVETARRAGCRSILVRTGAGGQDGEYAVAADFVANDLEEAAAILLEQERRPAGEDKTKTPASGEKP
ncbi:MAG: HAD-IIIA family hydrolase [bacterium]|jgi:D-glycero-D-manno-heptose 1,7-bisphosphate phosphatase|nr:HAD-IIIA family hydrolase [candidate division KSB1 bacterium]MDH7560593.1 HAD-IIIA family hydrolase [bacterium]